MKTTPSLSYTFTEKLVESSSQFVFVFSSVVYSIVRFNGV